MARNMFKQAFYQSAPYSSEQAMTINGSLTKIGALLATAGFGGVCGAALFDTALAGPLMLVGSLVAVVSALVMAFAPYRAPYFALPYAFCQGISLALYSLFFEAMAPGIVIAAVSLSAATALAMYILYSTGLIRLTQTVRSIIMIGTAAVGLTYMTVFLFSLFGASTGAFFTSSSPISIGFSLFVVGLAASNLLLDFELIEEGAHKGLPQYMEWYAGVNLLATLIWLYVEMLRLLMKYSKRR